MIGSLGQPVLFLFALGFGFGPVFERAGQGNYLAYLSPGIISMSILFTSVFSGIEIIWDRQFGFLKETLVAPVPRWQIMLGRTLGGATVASLQGLLVLIISLLAGFRPQISLMLLLALFIIIITAVLFTALGTAIASVLTDMQGFHLIMNFLIMPLFFLSGALFPLKNLPEILSLLIYLDPLTYSVDGLRATLTGVSHFGLSFDLSVLIILSLVLTAVGSFLFSKIEI